MTGTALVPFVGHWTDDRIEIYAGMDAITRELAYETIREWGVIRERTIVSLTIIGAMLKEMKRRLGHGKFLPWLEHELRLRERTAQNYMLLAQSYGANAKHVAYLPDRTSYALASKAACVAEIRKDVLMRSIAGEEVSATEIDQRIKEARQRDKQAKADAKKTPEARAKKKKQDERAQRRRDKESQKWQAGRLRVKEARDAAVALLLATLDGDGFTKLIGLIEISDGIYLNLNDVVPVHRAWIETQR